MVGKPVVQDVWPTLEKKEVEKLLNRRHSLATRISGRRRSGRRTKKESSFCFDVLPAESGSARLASQHECGGGGIVIYFLGRPAGVPRGDTAAVAAEAAGGILGNGTSARERQKAVRQSEGRTGGRTDV